MENSFKSLLYASTYGVTFSRMDLNVICSQKDNSEAGRIFESLEPSTRHRLSQLNWKERWKKLLFQKDIHVTSLFCEDYPFSLHQTSRPPLVFLYRGCAVWNRKSLISVVGSRRPFSEALHWMTHHLASCLSAQDIGVVSGGARGVDQWAHQICILSGRPTVCVLPSGLNEVYPRDLNPLLLKIIDGGGAVLSGYELNQPMKKYFFYQRNEWIAALGNVCLVVQANQRSGTLVTAKHAAQLGKDVLALPFSPWLVGGEGNNMLIKDGAVPVTSSHDFPQV